MNDFRAAKPDNRILILQTALSILLISTFHTTHALMDYLAYYLCLYCFITEENFLQKISITWRRENRRKSPDKGCHCLIERRQNDL